MPCRIAGCQNSWTWFAAQQIRGFGQPPPDRMCDEHLGQFNELADREVPCRTPGCPNTWTWKRGAQLAEMQRTGKLRRPSRLCAECFTAERETHDVELPCKIDGCKRGWTWTRDAQLRHRLWVLRQRAKASRPTAAASAGAIAEGEQPEGETRREPDSRRRRQRAPEAEPTTIELDVTVERPIPFIDPPAALTTEEGSGEGSGEAFTAEPARDAAGPEAQVAEDMSAGTGLEGQVVEAVTDDAREARTEGEPGHAEEGEEGEGGDRRKRRRKRRRGGKPMPNPEGPPERMCGLCAQKLSRVQPREQPCKVHGCSRTWTWDRASQMRAWVLSGSDDVDYEPAAPRRMCEVCREFCRTHPDREVACGRPGCERSWTFKTGAQLQAFLAGRLADPLKLCGECAKGEFAASFRPGTEGGIPEGAETMPCVVPGCEGTWLYIPGMRLRETAYGELSPERMCDPHRVERGFAAAGPHEAPEVEVTAADLATDEVSDHDHEEHEHEPDPVDDAAAASDPHDDAESDEAVADEATEASTDLAAGEPEPS